MASILLSLTRPSPSPIRVVSGGLPKLHPQRSNQYLFRIDVQHQSNHKGRTKAQEWPAGAPEPFSLQPRPSRCGPPCLLSRLY